MANTAISNALDQLGASLGDAGYNLNGASVGADTAGTQERGQPAPAPLPASAARTPAAMPETPSIRQTSTSGMSIYV